MTQNARQAKKSRSFTVGVSFRLSSYYSLVRGTEIPVVRLTTEISVPLITEISVKSSAKADETS